MPVLAAAAALAWPLPSAAASAPAQASLLVCAEPWVLARVDEVRIRGDGFVPVAPAAADTPTPPAGTPGPYEILANIPLGRPQPEREMAPVYDAHLTVSVLRILEDKGPQPGLLGPGDSLSVVHRGLPRQPDYHPRQLVRLRLRLHCDRRDARKASYLLWQLVESSPPLDPDTAATFTPPFHLHSLAEGGDAKKQVLYARAFLRAVRSWGPYDGLEVPEAGRVSVSEKGGTFTCLIGGEPVRRATVEIGAESASAQALHDFAFHDRSTLTPAMVQQVYRLWKQLKAGGFVDER